MSEKIRIRWLTNACFEIHGCGQVVLTDPCLKQTTYKGFDVDSFDQVDHVVVSHLHWDHITELPDIYRKFHPCIFTGVMGADLLATWLDCNTSYIYPMFPDQELDMGPVKIKMLYNRHANVDKSKSEQTERCKSYDFMKDYPGMDALQSMGGMEMCSYLITFENGFKVLFWGGDISHSQIAHLRGLKPDVAFIQYSKQGAEAYTELANAIEPGVSLPHHTDLKNALHSEIVEAKIAKLKAIYKGKLICPENGQWMEFDVK